MQVSQKTRYALRAMFELAKHYQQGPLRISDIAKAQAIPVRFLEGILNQLRQTGLLRSTRGSRGGYELVQAPQETTVGEMIRILEGPVAPTECVDEAADVQCPLHGDCVFMPMWQRAADALAEVYDNTTFEDLLEEERRRCAPQALNYTI